MVGLQTSYSVDNDKRFQQAVSEAAEAVSDLRIPLTLISKDFFRSQSAIFKLKGPGQYPDFGGLSPDAEKTAKARERKRKLVGFDYPLLVGKSKALKKSLTNPTHPDSINEIVNRTSLFMGTQVEHAIFHQSDAPRRKLPQRKVVFIGPEAKRFANSDQIGRLDRWNRILNEYVKQKSAVMGDVK